MAPRKYTMDKRKAAVEETRRRILEAILALRTEKGIFGTSWRDIAERADVSVATVYKHFPSLDESMPACGALIMAITAPPSPEDAPRIFGYARALEERLGRLISELFDFYERGEPYMEIGAKERQFPAVQQWEAGMRATREALRPVAPDERTIRAVSALLDFPTFKSFRRHGVAKAEAEEILNAMMVGWLEGP